PESSIKSLLEIVDPSRLVEGPASSLTYVDPAFPNRALVLHSARPRDYHTGTPVLFVRHGVRRNGRDYRDYWLDLVDEAGVLAISIGFPEASFPEHLWYHFGNLHVKEGTPNPRGRMDIRHRRKAVRTVACPRRHDPPTLRVVRPFRGRTVPSRTSL